MFILAAIGLYRLLLRYTVMIVLIYGLPFGLNFIAEESEEQFERIEILDRIFQAESRIQPHIPSEAIKVDRCDLLQLSLFDNSAFCKSVYFHLYDLHCQWLVERVQ